jgi:hypothetical protein
MDEATVLRQMYARFNARDMETLLATMAPDVMWANAFEGGHEHGREAVRAYWTRQWAAFDPHVEPVQIAQADGAWVCKVHQIVKDLEGKVLFDGTVEHTFRLENGLVQRFDVRETLDGNR